MRPRISIRGSVCPSVGQSVGPSVPSLLKMQKSPPTTIFLISILLALCHWNVHNATESNIILSSIQYNTFLLPYKLWIPPLFFHKSLIVFMIILNHNFFCHFEMSISSWFTSLCKSYLWISWLLFSLIENAMTLNKVKYCILKSVWFQHEKKSHISNEWISNERISYGWISNQWINNE